MVRLFDRRLFADEILLRYLKYCRDTSVGLFCMAGGVVAARVWERSPFLISTVPPGAQNYKTCLTPNNTK